MKCMKLGELLISNNFVTAPVPPVQSTPVLNWGGEQVLVLKQIFGNQSYQTKRAFYFMNLLTF